MGIKEAFRGRAENNANAEVPQTYGKVLSMQANSILTQRSKPSPFGSCARRFLSEKVKMMGGSIAK